MRRFSLFATLTVLLVLLGFVACSNGNGNENVYALPAPTDVRVTAGEKTNTIKLTFTNANPSASIRHYVYCNSSNDTTSAKIVSSFSTSFYYVVECSCDNILLSETGTYYFWVKATSYYSNSESDFSTPASYEFTYKKLDAPTDVSVESTDTKGEVKVSWLSSDNPRCFWIYYSTLNKVPDSGDSPKELKYDVEKYDEKYSATINLKDEKAGTYYFWVRAADRMDSVSAWEYDKSIYDNDSIASDFSDSATYTYSN